MIKIDRLIAALDKHKALKKKLEEGTFQLKALSQRDKFVIFDVSRGCPVCDCSSKNLMEAIKVDSKDTYIEYAEQVELLRKMGVDCRDEFRDVYSK